MSILPMPTGAAALTPTALTTRKAPPGNTTAFTLDRTTSLEAVDRGLLARNADRESPDAGLTRRHSEAPDAGYARTYGGEGFTHGRSWS